MELGLSEYEARTYLALLGRYPATAYETAREAGIPTSKIYPVLERLESRAMVTTILDEGRKRYAPSPPGEFLDGHRRRIESTVEGLRQDLESLHREDDVSCVWNIRDHRAFLEKAGAMVESTEREILLSAWAPEIRQIEGCLNAAAARGVRIATVLFGEYPLSAGTVFHHPIEDTIYQEKGGRGMTLVCDSRSALVGTIPEDGAAEGAWSMNRGFVTLAEDYVKHDIYIMKIVRRFDRELMGMFGDNYRLLRDIFSDREVSHDKG